MTFKYFLDGLVHPERAQIKDHGFTAKFTHVGSEVQGSANVRILLNQVAVWVETEVEWKIWDLRNVVRYLVQAEVDMFGFLLGHSYQVEIRRIICPELTVDTVFGIDVPCIKERHDANTLAERVAKLRPKLEGADGIFMHRCLRDLVKALNDSEDVAFYCYRAIESLRQHRVAVEKLDPKDKALHWTRMREITKCDEASMRTLEKSAQAARHGGIDMMSEEDHVKLLNLTWDIAEGYIANS
jgi:hypothetical protein